MPKSPAATEGGHRPDYVPHGSAEHAAMLGLRKAEKEDTIQEQGWTLADMAQFPPGALPMYLQDQLKSRVRVLTTKPEVPANAPPLWMPSEEDVTGLG